MTLEQSEFQQLVELLAKLVNRYRKNPAVLEAILAEFRDLYKKVPIYPSIVSMCLEKVVNPIRQEEVREGEEVVLTLEDGRTISGRVIEVSSADIKLVEARQLIFTPTSEKTSIERNRIKDVKRIDRKILKKEWPSLDFEV